MIPDHVVSDHNANERPNDREIRADPTSEHRGNYREEDPCVVAHQIVESDDKGWAGQAHENTAECCARRDTFVHYEF